VRRRHDDRQQARRDVPAPLTTLTVVSQVGAHGELSRAVFERALLQGAAVCGLRVSVTPQLEPGASVALTMTWGGSNQERFGSVRSIRYKATLFEPPSQRVLWQADLSLMVDTRSSTDRRAEALARDLLAKLRRDHLTSPCTTG
jgi:hypothetical protein